MTGVLGTISMRIALLLAGVSLLERFHWMTYIFGGLLVLSWLKMLLQKKEKAIDVEKNTVFKIMKKFVPISSVLNGSRLSSRSTAVGLSLTIVGAMNVVVLSTPNEYSRISLGTTTLLRIVGSAIGPALAAMYLQSNQSVINIGGIIQRFPSAESYNLIFLSGILILAVFLRHRAIKMAIPNPE